MQRTKYGFYVGFDTTKRKKYSDEKRKEIARLKVEGHSIRQIAKILNIPNGSIHYILREFNLMYPESVRPTLNHLTRSEAKYLYDMTDAQFDYARTFHTEFTSKVNNIVYLHIDYIYDYIEDNKGYKDRWKK